MTHLICGFGDVGRGLYEIMKAGGLDVEAIDKDANVSGHFDTLHICFPFSDAFIGFVKDYISAYTPHLVIIHATVPPGITAQLQQFFEKTVHSPVRGRHPSMARDMKVYTKYFGGAAAEEAAAIFAALGIKTKCFAKPGTTELGKLLCNIRWGLNIAFAQEQKRICEHFQLDYGDVVNEFETSRNEGLRQIGRENAQMPVLYPGIIGGHCVMPNVDILMKNYASGFLSAIKESNDTYSARG